MIEKLVTLPFSAFCELDKKRGWVINQENGDLCREVFGVLFIYLVN